MLVSKIVLLSDSLQDCFTVLLLVSKTALLYDSLQNRLTDRLRVPKTFARLFRCPAACPQDCLAIPTLPDGFPCYLPTILLACHLACLPCPGCLLAYLSFYMQCINSRHLSVDKSVFHQGTSRSTNSTTFRASLD